MENANDHDSHGSGASSPLLTKANRERMSVQKALGQQWTALSKDWWLWELIAAVTVAGAIFAIVLILYVVDNSPRPDWPHFITINSAISFFATIAKLAMSSVVGSALNQSKWLWYRQGSPKPIQDLQMFDDASRGPLGAATLIMNRGARHLGFIGCIVVILSLLFDPFIQQVVVYPDHGVPAPNAATVSRAVQYGNHESESLSLPSVVHLSMKGAVYNGIFAIKDEASMGVGHSCPTGNCSYPQFSSLAVCNVCENITEYIHKTCDHTGCHKLSLPGGLSLSGLGGQINTSLTAISPKLNEVEASLCRLGLLTSTSVNDPYAARALECVFYYCINRYETVVSHSLIKENILYTWRNDSARHNASQDLIYRPPPSFLDTKEDPEEFRISALSAKSLSAFMRQTLTGSGGLNESGSAFSSDVLQALYKQANLSARMDNLAISMSNNIREQNDRRFAPVNGTAWENQTYVHVRWAWFSFPACVTFLAVLFLAGSMIQTSQMKILVWKSSNLALLFHGRGLHFRGIGHDKVSTVSHIDAVVGDMDVKLVQDNGHEWRLSED